MALSADYERVGAVGGVIHAARSLGTAQRRVKSQRGADVVQVTRSLDLIGARRRRAISKEIRRSRTDDLLIPKTGGREVHRRRTSGFEALYNHCGEASEECLAELTGLRIDTIVRMLRDWQFKVSSGGSGDLNDDRHCSTTRT